MSFNIVKSKATTTVVLIVVSFLLSHILFFGLPGIFQTWEFQTSDQLFKIRTSLRGHGEPVDPNVALVYLDDRGIESLNDEYRSGDLYTTITNLLGRTDVSVFGYDIIFARKNSIQNLEQFIGILQSSGNAYTANAFRLTQGTVSIPSSYSKNAEFFNANVWKPTVITPGTPVSADTPFTATMTELSGVAKGFGFINAVPDRDGTFRRIPLVVRYNDGFIPSLPFSMVCGYLDVKPENISIDFGNNITLRDAVLPDGNRETIVIPIDEEGRMILNFPGDWKAFKQQYSIARMTALADDDEQFSQLAAGLDGAIVFIADVSTGSGDIGPIPYQAHYPLTGLHMTVINSILTKNFLSTLNPAIMYGILTVLLLSLLVLSLKVRPVVFAVTSVGLIALYFVFAVSMFVMMNTLSPVVLPLITVGLSFGSILVYRYFSEEKEKAFIRNTFSTYFSPVILKKIENNPDLLSLGGERKELTVLFSDIVGFTKWSSTQSPEIIKQTVNEYFEEMATIIFKHDGYIDKYIGDGMMAFFGDPIHQEDHALRCVKAAIEMQKKIREIKAAWTASGRLSLQVRIGINTGEMIVGNMGSKSRMDYTVLGANVNLAQRLEANAPIEGILISDSVYQYVQGMVETKEIDDIQVKGLTGKVKVYEVIVS